MTLSNARTHCWFKGGRRYGSVYQIFSYNYLLAPDFNEAKRDILDSTVGGSKVVCDRRSVGRDCCSADNIHNSVDPIIISLASDEEEENCFK